MRERGEEFHLFTLSPTLTASESYYYLGRWIFLNDNFLEKRYLQLSPQRHPYSCQRTEGLKFLINLNASFPKDTHTHTISSTHTHRHTHPHTAQTVAGGRRVAERHINLCINVSLRRFVKLKVSEEEDGARVLQCCTTRWWTVHLHHPQRQLPFSCTSDLIKTHMILQFSSSCHVSFGRAWLLQWNCLQRKAQRLYFYCIYSAPVFLILHLCSLVRAVNNKDENSPCVIRVGQ